MIERFPDHINNPFDRVDIYGRSYIEDLENILLENHTAGAIRHTPEMAHVRLRPGGKLIGIDWFSTEHEGASRGAAVDSYTRRDIESGSLSGLGEIHLFGHAHLVELLTGAGLTIEFLEHKHNELFDPMGERHRAWWNFVAAKP